MKKIERSKIMRRVTITSMEIKEGNAQVSSDYIAKGIDNLITGMNLTLKWSWNVKCHEKDGNIVLEVDGEDEKLCSQILYGMFKDVTIEEITKIA
jgi:hypothetical protein